MALVFMSAKAILPDFALVAPLIPQLGAWPSLRCRQVAQL